MAEVYAALDPVVIAAHGPGVCLACPKPIKPGEMISTALDVNSDVVWVHEECAP